MSAALAVWSVRIEPGKKAVVVPQSDIRITGAALDATLADEKARSSVKLTYVTPQAADEDEEEEDGLPPFASTILCSLTPGRIEQANLDLVVNEDDELEFEVVGKNAVYLIGNYITQPTDFPADEDESDLDEEDYDLREVSSDVEIDPSEIDDLEEEDDSHRFEEINDEVEKKEEETPSAPPSKKRPRKSDAVESATDGETKLSKKQLKKLKKQKMENGEAMANGDSKPEKKDAKQGHEATTEKTKDKKEQKKEKHDSGDGGPKKAGQTRVTPSGLKIQDVKTGSGKAAKKGNKVSMRYVGKSLDGKVFDSNTKGKPFEFVLGAGEVIKGWDEGIAGMQAGGERLLIVPPKLGYGSRKIGDKIPANSTLRFECKLLEVK